MSFAVVPARHSPSIFPRRSLSSSILPKACRYIFSYAGHRANSLFLLFPAIGHPMHPTRLNPSAYSGFIGTPLSNKKSHTSSSVQSTIGLHTRFACNVQFSNSLRLSSLSLLRIIRFAGSAAFFSKIPRLDFRFALSAHRTPVVINRPAPLVP